MNDTVINILIVDDEILNIKSLRRLLRSRFKIFTAQSAEEAIDHVNTKNHFDLILLDIQMPVIDGLECCRRIKELDPFIPVIMMTALADDRSLQESFEAGAIDFIRKPINEAELLSRVNNTIRITTAEQRVRTLYSQLLDELNIASQVQHYFIPQWLINGNDFIISSVYEPCQKVGGDVFDVIKLTDDKHLIFIGDISGHGVQAALLMTAVRSVIKMVLDNSSDFLNIEIIFEKIEQILVGNLFDENYMTILIGIYDNRDGSFQYVNAGHSPVILFNLKNRETTVVKDDGPLPIGWNIDRGTPEQLTNTIIINEHTVMFLYTDGVFECADSDGNILELNGLADLIRELPITNDTAIAPYLLRQALIDGGYDLSGDDFMIMSLIPKNKSESSRLLYQCLYPNLDDVEAVAHACEKKILQETSAPELSAKVELVVTELLNNIVCHGKLSAKEDIFLILNVGDQILIKVWDKGGKWDLNKALSAPRGDMDISGRGLLIINDISEEFMINRYANINQSYVKIARESSNRCENE